MRIVKKENLFIDKVSIPVTHTKRETIYFVSGSNGDEFGQFKTEESARVRLNIILSIPKSLRSKYDQ